MGAAGMNPLLTEFSKRQNSRHTPTSRNAPELLLASIHEAGHWLAFAHYRVPVVSAVVDRGPKYISGGCVTPASFLGYVKDEMMVPVDYVTTLAGAATHCALMPFVGMEDIKAMSMGDGQYAKALFDRVFGSDRAARKDFRDVWVPHTEQMIHLNWPIVEALAYELMHCGKFLLGDCRKIEERYGIARHNITAAKRESAHERLAAFHSSPDDLLEWLGKNA